MEKNEIMNVVLDFLINLIITAFIYMIIPIIIFFLGEKELTEKQIKKYTVINSTVGFIVFIILFIILNRDLNILTGGPAFFYGAINYWLLSKHKKQEDDFYINKEYEKAEDEKLQNLINKLQEENTYK